MTINIEHPPAYFLIENRISIVRKISTIIPPCHRMVRVSWHQSLSESHPSEPKTMKVKYRDYKSSNVRNIFVNNIKRR